MNPTECGEGSKESGMNPTELREYSPITWGLERAFYVLQRLSVATWLLGTRVGAQTHAAWETDKKAITKRRGRRIEAYVGAWAACEAVLVLVSDGTSRPVATAATAAAAYRLGDIFQAGMNLNLFDRLRVSAPQVYVASLARTAILSVWNFFEAAVCFGIIYASNRCLLKCAADGTDAYYFSAVTQLTVGYGDVTPTGPLRGVAMAQGALGFVLGIFAISRVIAFLPRTQSVMRDE
jgi:hypothetical protein